jgi:predicted nucleic-acid-binding protein
MPRRRKGALLDTNVLLRFLLGDDPVQSPGAEKLMKRLEQENERAELEESVVAETVWVLEKAIGVPRSEIALHLASIIEIPGVVCRNKGIVLDALSSFSATGCDIVDCLLAARARSRGAKVYSFDADFEKLGCAFEAPR